MSEQDDTTATAVVVGLIIAIVVGLMLCACCAYSRYRTLRARKNSALNADLVAESCIGAMASCFCCCGEYWWRAGTGASDVTVSAANAVKNGTKTAVTESTSFWWFMCNWLGWLLRYVFCCCCYNPRDDVPASEANAGLPVAVPVAVPVENANGPEAGKGDGSQPAAVPAVRVEPQPAKPQSADNQPPAESASVTTPLLALAV